MAVMVSELYEALRGAGVEEEAAKAAARAVLAADARTDLATHADLVDLKAASKADLGVVREELAALKETVSSLRWMFGVNWAFLTLILGVVLQLLLRGRP